MCFLCYLERGGKEGAKQRDRAGEGRESVCVCVCVGRWGVYMCMFQKKERERA